MLFSDLFKSNRKHKDHVFLPLRKVQTKDNLVPVELWFYNLVELLCILVLTGDTDIQR